MNDVAERNVPKGMLPLLALFTLIEYHRLARKPSVTAALIAANTLIYLRPPLLNSLTPSIDGLWFNSHLIIKLKGMKRFFLPAFYHLGESHLVYNMICLVWKGIELETSMGSLKFASMVVSLLVLSEGIILMLSKSLSLFYYIECPVGFSGILFAMEIVVISRSLDYTCVHGVILLIQMFVPGASFLGHLGGTLAGLLYVELRPSYSGSDPLTFLMRGGIVAFNWTLMFSCYLFRFWRRGINAAFNWTLKFSLDLFGYCLGMISGGGNRNRTGRTTTQSAFWRCQACTYDNSGLLSVCEICGTRSGGNGLSSFQLDHDPHGLSLDGLGSPEIKELLPKRKNFIKPPEPPKEPVFFRCPICTGPFVEEMSTRCGHIFCKNCIKPAIRFQGKCPTCRKNITMEDLIRVFLPSTN